MNYKTSDRFGYAIRALENEHYKCSNLLLELEIQIPIEFRTEETILQIDRMKDELKQYEEAIKVLTNRSGDTDI
ncbi:MAG: hypothetical protein KBT03_10975 [Bacteroidales bacterium]|nr:hypothetical protein [Candidatus Scybalousia scybalohippi]